MAMVRNILGRIDSQVAGHSTYTCGLLERGKGTDYQYYIVWDDFEHVHDRLLQALWESKHTMRERGTVNMKFVPSTKAFAIEIHFYWDDESRF
jgi:hypothetical protein